MNDMDKLDKIITESINDFINEDMVMHREPLLEMARINKKETGRCIFPCNKWEVKIWSDDHNPLSQKGLSLLCHSRGSICRFCCPFATPVLPLNILSSIVWV